MPAYARDHADQLTAYLVGEERSAVRSPLFYAILVGYYHHHFSEHATPEELVTLLEAADAEGRRTLAEPGRVLDVAAYERLLAEAYDYGRRHAHGYCRFCTVADASGAIARRLVEV